jgi:hypothetical protein
VFQFKEIVLEMSKKNSQPSHLDKIRGSFLRHLRQSASVASGQGHFLGFIETHVVASGMLCAGFVEGNKNKVHEELLVYPIDKVFFTFSTSFCLY